MEFEAHYPVHRELKQHIAFYYFARTRDKMHKSIYHSYPTITIPINIHKNVICELKEDEAVIRGTDHSPIVTIANGLRERALIVQWNGLIDKVTIAFTPVGINHFITKSLGQFIHGYANIFSAWNGDAFTSCVEAFYATDDNHNRVRILEDFLVGIYRPFDKAHVLQEAIEILSAANCASSVPQIARQINVSERTLNRLFQSYIGVSPITYRKIARFRKSLEDKVVSATTKRLTDIGYENNYYDQSYFIKIYNQLTGKSPKMLYNAIDKLADDKVLFEFIKSPVDFGGKVQF